MTDTPDDLGPEPDPMPRMWLDETAGLLDMVTRKYADWHRRRAERAERERDEARALLREAMARLEHTPSWHPLRARVAKVLP